MGFWGAATTELVARHLCSTDDGPPNGWLLADQLVSKALDFDASAELSCASGPIPPISAAIAATQHWTQLVALRLLQVSFLAMNCLLSKSAIVYHN